MESGSYRFALGAFQCLSISDGAFNYPLEAFFANVPRADVEDVLRRDDLPTDRITTPYTCLAEPASGTTPSLRKAVHAWAWCRASSPFSASTADSACLAPC